MSQLRVKDPSALPLTGWCWPSRQWLGRKDLTLGLSAPHYQQSDANYCFQETSALTTHSQSQDSKILQESQRLRWAKYELFDIPFIHQNVYNVCSDWKIIHIERKMTSKFRKEGGTTNTESEHFIDFTTIMLSIGHFFQSSQAEHNDVELL